MSDNLFTVTPLGVITVDTSDIITDVQQNYLATFGNTLNTDASTPQGQLINNDVAILQNVQNDLLDLANSFSVYYAVGDQLDIVGGFFGYYRKKDVATIVLCTLTGLANTVIDAGSLASDNNYEYKLLNSVVIGQNGTVENCEFQCITTGDIPCLANTLTNIITTKAGWDAITNPSDGIVGFDQENDNIFRQRVTANYLNIRATALMPAILDNIAQINGVLSVKGNENQTNITQIIDGIQMVSHSIYLCILGGSDEDIAKVIYNKKTLGTAMNGNVIISHIDPMLQHSYNYNIYRPSSMPVKVQINYLNNTNTPININELLINQLISYVQENLFMIGQTISGTLLSEAFDNYDLCNILSLKVNLVTEEGYVDYVTFNNFQIATLSCGDITTNLIE